MNAEVASILASLLADPELLDSREELALMTIRTQELCARLSRDDSAEWRKSLKDAANEYSRALAGNDADGAKEHLGTLLKLAEAGAAIDEGWELLISTIERRAALAQKESKRMIDIRAVFTVDQVGYMLSVIADSVKRYVADPVIIQRITQEFDAAFSGGATPGD
ncbi:MAG: hypothetical protein JNM18_14530 [Planctomycetaceae bacterium]|nr:hypothetical protein [Planctomycetaceae bacterium]